MNIGLISFSPTSGYPGFDLYRCVYLVCVVQDCLHPFDHCILQPRLYGRRLPSVALDNDLVVADEHRHGSRALASSLPLQG
jgi:hypothetical protein